MNWNSIAQNWKTTVSAILTVTLTTSAALVTYPPVQQHPNWIAVIGGVQIVAKVWIGLLQHDAQPMAEAK